MLKFCGEIDRAIALQHSPQLITPLDNNTIGKGGVLNSKVLHGIFCRSLLQDDTHNRDDWIRTSGPFVPNEVRYQAALHPVNLASLSKLSHLKTIAAKNPSVLLVVYGFKVALCNTLAPMPCDEYLDAHLAE